MRIDVKNHTGKISFLLLLVCIGLSSCIEQKEQKLPIFGEKEKRLGGGADPGFQSRENLIWRDFFRLPGVTKFEFDLTLGEAFLPDDQMVGCPDQVSVIEFDPGPFIAIIP